MSAGLAALLDDVAVLTRAAAASVDDVAAGAGRASMKAAGVIVDDAAVTPRYVQGFQPERELPMIKRIAVGSLRNKLLFILPAALVLSEFLEWLLTPILMLGGVYLCYEGAEKLWELVTPHAHAETAAGAEDPADEDELVGGAIRTDFILSAEIMVISLNEVADEPLLSRALILVVVAFAITAGVYGAVALIVKMDDVGLHLAQARAGAAASFGRGLVRAMPVVLSVLSKVGIAAMLWVGGHILLVGLDELGLGGPYDTVHHARGGRRRRARRRGRRRRLADQHRRLGGAGARRRRDRGGGHAPARPRRRALERGLQDLARERRGGRAALARADQHHGDGDLRRAGGREGDEPGVGVLRVLRAARRSGAARRCRSCRPPRRRAAAAAVPVPAAHDGEHHVAHLAGHPARDRAVADDLVGAHDPRRRVDAAVGDRRAGRRHLHRRGEHALLADRGGADRERVLEVLRGTCSAWRRARAGSS